MNNYQIIQLNSNEIERYREDILSLWKENLSNGTEYRFDWLYTNSPTDHPITWLAVDRNNQRIIGCNSLFPLETYINGNRVKIGLAIDFAIDKKHRVFGPALLIQKGIIQSSRKNGFDLLLAWPSQSSSEVFSRAGYRTLGKVKNLVKIIRFEGKISKYIPFYPLSKLIAFFLDMWIDIVDLMVRFIKPKNLFTEILEIPDVRFDNLWSKVKNDHFFTQGKNSIFLKWRYSDSLAEDYAFFCLFDNNDDSLLGYIVYSLKENVAVIWDLISLNNNLITFLITEFAVKMRRNNISSISLICLENQNFEKKLKRIGFVKKNLKREFFVFIVNDTIPFQQEIIDKNAWLILDGDLDL